VRARLGSGFASDSRRRIATGLFALGAAVVLVALATDLSGITVSALAREASLLLTGCDLLLAGLVVSPHHEVADAIESTDTASLLSAAIADGLMMCVATGAAVLVLFGASKPIEPAELVGYLLGFLVVVPLTVTIVWRRWRAGRIREPQRLEALAVMSATAGLLCALRLLRLPSSGTLDTSLVLLLGLGVARAAIALSMRNLPADWLRRLPPMPVTAVMPLVLAAAAAPFVPPATRSITDVVAASGAALVGYCAIVACAGRGRLTAIQARVADLVVVLACALVVVYLGRPDRELALNHNYFLGPANDVLHGHAMLVGTFSQYGVALMDALAAVFLVVPIGYGTFTLLLSALTALLFAVIYAVLRWSTGSVLLAAAGLTVSIVLYVFGQIDVYAFFPSTGVLRFGLPWLVILMSLATVRCQRHKHLVRGLTLATVGVAAAWSGETGVYCLVTAGALAGLEATVIDASGRRRLLFVARRAVQLLSASAMGVLAFTLVTRVTVGVWPSWGGYLEYIRLYTIGGLGTVPIGHWSPGLALATMYMISAIAIVLVATTRPAFVRERAVAFHAATGLTALGAVVYTYFLDRAEPNNLIHISPPAVALLFVWLGILRSTLDSRVALAFAGSAVIFLGTMIVASERDEIGNKYHHTALAAVLGSAPSLGAAVHSLSSNPVVDPMSARVVDFVAPLWNKRARLTILLIPGLQSEALLRLGTANAVGSSNPCQDSLAEGAPARVAAAVRSLAPGGILVTSAPSTDAGKMLPIQRYTLALLRARFTLREIEADKQGLQAFRMTSVAPTVSPPIPAPRWVIPPFGCA